MLLRKSRVGSKYSPFINACIIFIFLIISHSAKSQIATVSSPDGRAVVNVYLENGKISYDLSLAHQTVLERSPLGLKSNLTDLSTGLAYVKEETSKIEEHYRNDKIKKSDVNYVANALTCYFSNSDNIGLAVIFQLDNHNLAFRYKVFKAGENDLESIVIEEELTGFNLKKETSCYITPQAAPMVGYARTKPSDEEAYLINEPLAEIKDLGYGYTFPCLFQTEDLWLLISETGVDGSYCSSHLSAPDAEGVFSVLFPRMGENNGFGSTGAAVAIPAFTPWRTVTFGENLKPVVETTIAFDVVNPAFEASQDYQFGRGTWSWIMWQDASMNEEDQRTYIDFAAELGYEYILIDAWWDRNIGYDRMAELVQYAASKNVGVFLWYNSNGVANDAPQTPKNKMHRLNARRAEMAWMQQTGIKGIKVDFFGGDKQQTMQLYEDILFDANDFGLMVIFHGTTLPRGWERMYPNYVGSEAVLASENLMFRQDFNDIEAINATLHPFIRNAVGSMEYGGVVMNKRYNRTNDGGNYRRTTDVFQLAIAVLFQNPVQFFALAPNNLQDAPDFAMDFLKTVPTTWDQTLYIDGKPGEYCVIARKSGEKWYVAGVNATNQRLDLKLSLPMISSKEVMYYADNDKKEGSVKSIKINKGGNVNVSMQPEGGLLIQE